MNQDTSARDRARQSTILAATTASITQIPIGIRKVLGQAVPDDLVRWKKYLSNSINLANVSSGQLFREGQQCRLYTMHLNVRVYFPSGVNAAM